jgi:hypothetical protein
MHRLRVIENDRIYAELEYVSHWIIDLCVGGTIVKNAAGRILLKQHDLDDVQVVWDFVDQMNQQRLRSRSGRADVTPTPAEFVRSWPGHGYFWKSSSSQVKMNCVGELDFDEIEGGFCKVLNAKVLYADYQGIAQEFKGLDGMQKNEVDRWLVDNCAFISEGQVKRIQKGGELFDWMDIKDIESVVDLKSESRKAAIRMKGGGRVAIFFANDQYSFDAQGNTIADMLDVKGVGTSIMQTDADLKACGFLSAVDAFRELAFQRLLERISEFEITENGSRAWGTVKYLAVIDTGIRFKQGVINPATGYSGDRCVLVVRQRNSRFVGSKDEIAYYSVVDQTTLFENNHFKRIINCMNEWGISSEQMPTSLLNSKDHKEAGDWNIQCTAFHSKLVDFSHFYVLPHSKLSSEWRMSLDAVKLSLKAGFRYNSLFSEENNNLAELVFNCSLSNSNEKQQVYEQFISQEFPQLKEQCKHLGIFGLRKPSYCWSWFLEFDDSPISKMAFTLDDWFSAVEFIDSCLPAENSKK